MFKKRFILALFLLISNTLLKAQAELISIEGYAQGTTYHIIYFDEKNRDFKPEIEQILKDFDASVSTYLSNSIISRINNNQKNVSVDK